MGTTTMEMEKVGLQTVSVPVLGLGTYQSPPGVVGQAVEWALEAGYRYFDCAIVYGNEAEIGEAINKWIKEGRVDRRDLFITTKLPLYGLRPELVEYYCDISLSNLGLEYQDQYLIHGPCGVKKRDDWTPGDGFPWALNSQGLAMWETDTDHVALWRAMEQLVYKGKARTGLHLLQARYQTHLLCSFRVTWKGNNTEQEGH